MDERLTYDPRSQRFFVNFERLAIKTEEDMALVRAAVTAKLGHLGREVDVILNYDHFSIRPDLDEAYIAMVKDFAGRYYAGVTRYTTSTFLRMKLGRALAKRPLAPHIYDSEQEAPAAARGRCFNIFFTQTRRRAEKLLKDSSD